MTAAEPVLAPLPASFVATRESLRGLACYVVAPARKAVEGRIGLRPTGGGIGTPVLPDGTRIVIRGDELVHRDRAVRITTVAAAAELLDVTLSDDPGVGHDLPPFEPARPLEVDAGASLALGAWYSFAQAAIDRLAAAGRTATWTEAQLWPEHFDLATEVTLAAGTKANVGFSGGDGYHADPYLYVGPHDMSGLAGSEYWNAPFGAVLGYDSLRGEASPGDAAAGFVETGLALLGR